MGVVGGFPSPASAVAGTRNWRPPASEVHDPILVGAAGGGRTNDEQPPTRGRPAAGAGSVEVVRSSCIVRSPFRPPSGPNTPKLVEWEANDERRLNNPHTPRARRRPPICGGLLVVHSCPPPAAPTNMGSGYAGGGRALPKMFAISFVGSGCCGRRRRVWSSKAPCGAVALCP